MYPEIYNPARSDHGSRSKQYFHEASFRCKQCGALVYAQSVYSGVQNRNHCPYCLHSRHVDHTQAGDRLSACKAIMLPIGLTVKPGRNKYKGANHGELMLIHRCSVCGKLSINRLAADDLVERLLELFYASLSLDAVSQQQLSHSGIHLLGWEDSELVKVQLWGVTQD